MRVSKNWVKFNKMFTLSPWVETLLATLTESADSRELAQNWARLAQHFDSLFTTQSSIDALKQTILQLAVMGKLVPQDPNDEPASVLLERIATEKARLVKECKIKKSKPLPEITEEEIPFELPEGWEWCRLGHLSNINGGFAFKSINYKDEGVRVVRISDFDEFGFKFDNIVRHSYTDSLSQFQLEIDDILMAMTGGTVGKSYLVKEFPELMVVNQRVAKISLFSGVIPEFVNALINSLSVRTVIDNAKNSTNDNISMGDITGFYVPLPPLPEQLRVVYKLNELMSLCDQLEQKSEASLAAHQTLVETLLATLTESADSSELAQNWARLAQHFDSLFTTQSSIDALKQTILQLAVMGKLVPQDPNDESASILLERIAAEKARLIKEGIYQKTSKLLPKDNVSYPSGWVEVQVGELCPSIVPNRDKPKTFNGIIPWVTLPSFPVDSWYLDPDNVEFKLTDEEAIKYSARIIPVNSVLMSCVGRFGLSAINTIPVSSNQQVHAYVVLNGLLPEYLSCVIRAIGVHLYEMASATTIAYINKTKCESIQFGLPPTNEQHRIVAKIDELLALCDQLSARLQASQTTQLHLAEALVEGALN